MRYLAKCTSDIRDKYTSVTTSRSNRLLLGNTNHLSQTKAYGLPRVLGIRAEMGTVVYYMEAGTA
jgi:hypothetical protein